MKSQLKHFHRLAQTIESLPGIGKKSALRLTHHLTITDPFMATKLMDCLEKAHTHVRLCTQCNALSENEVCEICLDANRDTTKLCIVASPKDIFMIEESGSFEGHYFVLSHLEDTQIDQLLQITKGVKEVLFAFAGSLQNESLMLFIEDKLAGQDIVFYKMATGIPNGVSLENVDMLSLTQAISAKVEI